MMNNDFQKEDLQAPLAEINMTPLVDIMLVLLVVLLVSAPVINSAITVDLPKEKAQIIDDSKAINIFINRDGEFFLEETKMTAGELERHLQDIAKENSQHKIHLQADKKVAYESVAKVLSIAQKFSLSNISFITQN